MFPVWTAVQVSNPDHFRAGQAGSVQGTSPDHPDEVAVKFDVDGVTAIVKVSDLKQLG